MDGVTQAGGKGENEAEREARARSCRALSAMARMEAWQQEPKGTNHGFKTQRVFEKLKQVGLVWRILVMGRGWS